MSRTWDGHVVSWARQYAKLMQGRTPPLFLRPHWTQSIEFLLERQSPPCTAGFSLQAHSGVNVSWSSYRSHAMRYFPRLAASDTMQAYTDWVPLASHGWRGDACVPQQEIESPNQAPISTVRTDPTEPSQRTALPASTSRWSSRALSDKFCLVRYPRMTPRSFKTELRSRGSLPRLEFRAGQTEPERTCRRRATDICYHNWNTAKSYSPR